MCDPVVTPLLIGSMVVSAVGAGVSAYGQHQAGEYQKDVQEQNARMQEAAAVQAMSQASTEAGLIRTKGTQLTARARTQIADAGVDLSSGSALDVIADSRMMNELDVQTRLSIGERQAYGYKVGAVNSRAEGELASLRGTYGAVATLLTGAGTAMGQASAIGKLGGGPQVPAGT